MNIFTTETHRYQNEAKKVFLSVEATGCFLLSVLIFGVIFKAVNMNYVRHPG